jgi:hypothetical protein
MKRMCQIIGWGLFVAVCNGVPEGPRGGRLLENDAPRAEFFVNAERRVVITFYDEQMTPVAPAGQVVRVMINAPGGRRDLSLSVHDGALVSDHALPEGDGYLVVVSIRMSAEAPAQIFRILYHAEICQGCSRAEYACTCEHPGGHEGHGH